MSSRWRRCRDLLVTDVGPGLQVLFATGFAENASIGNGHHDVGLAMIAKPFAVDVFGHKACKMLDRRTPSMS